MSTESPLDQRFSQAPILSLSEATPPSSTFSDQPTFNSFSTTEAAFSFQGQYNMQSNLQNKLGSDPDKMQGTSPFPQDEDMDEMPLDRQMQNDEDFDIDLDVGDMIDGKYDDGDIDLDIDVDFDGQNTGFMEHDLQMGSPGVEEQNDVMLDDAIEPHEEDIELRDGYTMTHTPSENVPIVEPLNDGIPVFTHHIQAPLGIDTLVQESPTHQVPLDNVSSNTDEVPFIAVTSTAHTDQREHEEVEEKVEEIEKVSGPLLNVHTDLQAQESYSLQSPTKFTQNSPVRAQLSPNQTTIANDTGLSSSPLINDVLHNEVRTSQAETLPLDNTPVVVQKEWSETTSATFANDSQAGADDDYQNNEDFQHPEEDDHIENTDHIPTTEQLASPVVGSPIPEFVANEPTSANISEAQNHDQNLAIHPVVVVYKGMEYSLFKRPEDTNSSSPKEPETFFFEDFNCITQPFGHVVRDVRQILGFDIAPDDELLISFEALGLSFEENNSAINHFTLSDVIGLFVQGSKVNDHESQAPLTFALETRVGYVAQLEMIKKHLNSGGNLETLSKARESGSSNVFHEDLNHDSSYLPNDESTAKNNPGPDGLVTVYDDPQEDGLVQNDQTQQAHQSDSTSFINPAIEHEGDDALELDEFEKYSNDEFDLHQTNENDIPKTYELFSDDKDLSDLPYQTTDSMTVPTGQAEGQRPHPPKEPTQDTETGQGVDSPSPVSIEQLKTGNKQEQSKSQHHTSLQAVFKNNLSGDESHQDNEDVRGTEHSSQSGLEDEFENEEAKHTNHEDDTFPQTSKVVEQVADLSHIESNNNDIEYSEEGDQVDASEHFEDQIDNLHKRHDDYKHDNDFEDNQHDDSLNLQAHTDDRLLSPSHGEGEPSDDNEDYTTYYPDETNPQVTTDETWAETDGLDEKEYSINLEATTDDHARKIANNIISEQNNLATEEPSAVQESYLDDDGEYNNPVNQFDDDDPYGEVGEFAVFPQTYNYVDDDDISDYNDETVANNGSVVRDFEVPVVSGEKRSRDDDDDDSLSITEGEANSLGPKRRRGS